MRRMSDGSASSSRTVPEHDSYRSHKVSLVFSCFSLEAPNESAYELCGFKTKYISMDAEVNLF